MILALAIFCKLVISLISSLSAVLKGKKDMKKDSIESVKRVKSFEQNKLSRQNTIYRKIIELPKM